MREMVLALIAKHKLEPSPELVIAMCDVYSAGRASVVSAPAATPAPTQGAGADEDDDATGSLTASDKAMLQRLGIDVNKKFRQRNSLFTIVGYKPSRWKFPISVVTQNGSRYKMTVDSVKRLQAAN
jgi:hypothetical protein